jgi:hypothetical protein
MVSWNGAPNGSRLGGFRLAVVLNQGNAVGANMIFE